MRRRTFLASLSGTATTLGLTGALGSQQAQAASGTVDFLEFDSSASLLDANRDRLTDDARIAVKAETSAFNVDDDSNGDAVDYGSTDVPLVAVDERAGGGAVVGFGAELVSDDANFESGNEEFLLNVWDAYLGGSGTVLYDEGHDQYDTLTTFSNMANYAETQANYAVSATSTLADDLSTADAVWITSPSAAFTASEQSALKGFVDDGGVAFVHDTADYSNFDETGNLNDLANGLDLAFRFNDDQVLDTESNTNGTSYRVQTTRFDTTFDFFADRTGMEIDPNASHVVDVKDVTDGDTVDVEFDSGRRENIRVLGMDTPEKEQYQQYERTQEWEGLESLTYLADWGANATDWAQGELSGKTVEIAFDDAEPGIFDQFDRLLAYIYYDGTGDGTRSEFYNRRTVANGYARVYSSSFSKHDSFMSAESQAQADGVNVWGASDPDASDPIRNRDADDLFFPTAASVRTSSGAIDPSRVPVVAESEATQTGSPSVSYGDVPLVGLDEPNNVGLVGAPLVDESYEQAEDYAVDTSTFENFVFAANLANYLGSRSGKVVVDGGHGQFSADYALSAEETAYFQRFLEGVDTDYDQVNDVTSTNLADAKAVVVSSPPQAFTSTELDVLSSFAADGGAVVLVGGSETTATARSNLHDVASALGSDLRLSDDQVEDGTNNVNDDATVPTTTRFDASFPLFSALETDGGTTGTGDVELVQVHADAEGTESENLNDEYVVFENVGDAAVDVTNYEVSDAAGNTYVFSEFSLDAGAQVTLHTGSGTDTSTDLYWGESGGVWNNTGDTVTLVDDAGSTVLSVTYDGDGFDDTDDGGSTVDGMTITNVSEDGATLNDEYVVVENGSTSAVDTTGWSLSDAAGYTYEFPDGFTLDASASVTIHTGKGTDTSTDLYWGYESAVWNNAGDTATLTDDAGNTVDTYSY
ncbi:lamin tail domain-containing protein [Halorubellus salinus]|uniref:lamin tail domain-containing protein n=1 Tax=Halorubellus salinus TaxID=755309 RepID=UPI001D07D43C|nr:lamin tail domain-containing protein [Halorubellus salinus]